MKPLSPSQRLALARLRGEYVDPPPVVAKTRSRFCTVLGKRAPEYAIRGKSGGRVGPR